MTMIYIGNLSKSTNASRTRSLFEGYGDILSLSMTPSASGHRFDNFGLVEMGESAAKKAIADLDGRVMDGAILSVREATESQLPKAPAAVTTEKPDDEAPRAIMRRHFEVAVVEKVDGPGGADGDDWHRYELVRGNSRITGFHRGTREEVAEYAAECGENFNERNRRGKAIRPTAPVRKK